MKFGCVVIFSPKPYSESLMNQSGVQKLKRKEGEY